MPFNFTGAVAQVRDTVVFQNFDIHFGASKNSRSLAFPVIQVMYRVPDIRALHLPLVSIAIGHKLHTA